jgi:hypothetical protein
MFEEQWAGTMTVDLVALRKALDLLMRHLIETRGLTHLDLPDELFWEVPDAIRFDMAADVSHVELDVGDLKQGVGVVGELLDGSSEPLAYLLTEVAPLVSAVGGASRDNTRAKGRLSGPCVSASRSGERHISFRAS